MSTFAAKGTDVDVEAIMANIRKKIEEKQKGLYTEDEVREIAEMKLDAVLDASQFNSDFVAAFRARDEAWNYRFGPETIYASSRGSGGFIRSIRRFLNPVLKLFFNPNPIIDALSRQADLNRYYVILLHNMSLELTRMNLELTNLKARLRTLGIRTDFQAKREKTLERITTRDPRDTRDSRATRDSRDSRDSRDRDSSSSGDRRRQRGRRNFRRRRGGGNRQEGGSGPREGNNNQS